MTKTAGEAFSELVGIMASLRGQQGCPWDRQQDMGSIKDYFLEEVHEALEAIAKGDTAAIREELGDVLFEVCFLARIAEEAGQFSVVECLEDINEKLIRRHPHVFGTEKVSEASEVPGRWVKLKAEEKAKKKDRQSILDGVPASLPPLLQALRVSERAVAAGFEWDKVEGVLEKLEEEIRELREAIGEAQSRERIEDELGDVLFTIVNVGRKLNIRAHDALLGTIAKFRRRFGIVEEELRRQGVPLDQAGLDRLEALWQKAKRTEKA